MDEGAGVSGSGVGGGVGIVTSQSLQASNCSSAPSQLSQQSMFPRYHSAKSSHSLPGVNASSCEPGSETSQLRHFPSPCSTSTHAVHPVKSFWHSGASVGDSLGVNEGVGEGAGESGSGVGGGVGIVTSQPLQASNWSSASSQFSQQSMFPRYHSAKASQSSFGTNALSGELGSSTLHLRQFPSPCSSLTHVVHPVKSFWHSGSSVGLSLGDLLGLGEGIREGTSHSLQPLN